MPSCTQPSFNPCYVGLWSVSILVFPLTCVVLSFNPCYVGLWSVSLVFHPDRFGDIAGFNPCYVGLWSVRDLVRKASVREYVSILVMLDYGL